MINKLSSRLGIKLFILLTAVITLSIGPLAYTSLRAISRYGEDVSAISEQHIRSQAFSYLKKITRERANRYQSFFDRISASAGLLSSQAATIYSNIPFFAEKPLFQNNHSLHQPNGFWTNSIDDPVVSIFWGAAEFEEQIRRELDALTHMSPLFQRVLEENQDVLASHMITMSGIGLYCSERQKSKEMVMDLPPLSVFDLRDGEPVTIFTRSANPSAGIRWTKVYKDDASEGLALTASASIYDDSGVFRGITGIDVPLDTVIEDILNIDDLDPENTILFAFLTDKDGRLIAFPQDYYEQFGIPYDSTKFIDSSDSLQLSLADSSLDVVRKLGMLIQGGQETFSTLDMEEGPLFVSTSRLPDLDWVFGLAVRQRDMFASVEVSRATLIKTIRTLEVNGIFLTLLTVLIALAIVFLSVKYLVMPLKTLATATKQVAGGDLSVRCPVTTRDETGVLAESFNAMVERLQATQERRQQYADSLEDEVEQRTSELVEKKSELEVTIDLLKVEVERRQIISEALRNSQQRYYETLEANRAGIYIITDGLFNYVNQSLADLFRSSPSELIGHDPLEYVADEDLSLTRENMEKRYRGIDIPPYRIRCVASDGTMFIAEVWSKLTSWENKEALVGTITDVSNIQQNEEKLVEQDIQLRKSLEEKEILLKEIYHRTKNNMLVIISMLELQMQDMDDERILSVFRDTENRIRAMALVHEKLYQSQDLSEIDLGIYLEEVVHSLVGNMVMAGKCTVEIAAEPTPINIDYAVPLGLVINEIVTNSLKHAFPGRKTGTIYLDLKKVGERKIRIKIGDNGIGLPDAVTIHETGSFGVQLISSLIKMQLKGDIEIEREDGTSYLIVFDIPTSTRRI